MNGAIKLLSWIFKILEIWKKNNNKFCFKKNRRKISHFQKTGLYVRETYQVYMCTEFEVNILKNDQLIAFLKVENDHFHVVSWHF